jgi:ribonuclease E
MGNKMLIDATHPEETRVVVLRGNRVEEFDFESATRKQLRGNIYLAKVTRVEPSLQAAFVNYGGNRHGFLAFSEIHPDYYQLPMAERQALKDEEFDPKSASDDPDDDIDDVSDPRASENETEDARSASASHEFGADDAFAEDGSDDSRQTAALEAALPAAKYSSGTESDDDDAADDNEAPLHSANEFPDSVETVEAVTSKRRTGRGSHRDDENGSGDENGDLDHVESVGSEDALEELPQRHRRRRRSYKIQEVIKRGQILLVQVVKEERGNKGAALTTYLSLAGRYTVLMPNTGSGGGISRKIASPADRKRLREIAQELDVSEGMGLIIRTAGAARTKTEIKRDYEYLLRLWENVRDLTLGSSAPCLVYEEGDLIKRSIRDLYSREIDEVLVAGDDAYRDAKDFMRMLMPSHAKNVQPYKEPEPVFTRYEVERQLNAMFSPQVTLPSGGYIIINQTEALVAVDVNSGKSTREFSIEDTALKTNLEASEEISRQLRLRDLAGLIVIDFIDMEERRNNRSVERKLKECLRNDRARSQVGRISHFGLMEMSRQRIRTGMVEGSTTQCPHCQGTGVVRSTESVALSVLRSLEDWLRTHTPCDLVAICSPDVALYILNQKRTYLHDIETRHNVTISALASDKMQGANFYIEKVAVSAGDGTVSAAISQNDRIIVPFESEQDANVDDKGRSRRKRRRRRDRDDSPESHEDNRASARSERDVPEDDEDAAPPASREAVQVDDESGEDGEKPRRRSRRRGRRGGRNQRGAKGSEAGASEASETAASGEAGPAADQPDYYTPTAQHADDESLEERKEQPQTVAAEAEAPAAIVEPAPSEPEPEPEQEAARADEEAGHDTRSFRSPRSRSRTKAANGSATANGQDGAESDHEGGGETLEADHEGEIALAEEPKAPPLAKPKGGKRGWWQRRDDA